MLNINNLTLSKAGKPLIAGLSLAAASGEVLTLTGVSGSGKSTLLNWMIGDLDRNFSATGELWLNGVRCDTRTTEARRVGILFQDDVLFPQLSVGQNMAFALPATISGAQARRQRVVQTLADIGLAGFHDRDPATLSGGQRARVSLMRTLLAEPLALLLDETFAKLDAILRGQFRAFVFEQIALHRMPTLMVTHDPADVPQGGQVIAISDWQHSHV